MSKLKRRVVMNGIKDQFLTLEKNLVLGHIRWSTAVGRPEGDLAEAFTFTCYHFDEEWLHPGGVEEEPDHPLSLHLGVIAWEGPHDPEGFQVSFLTDARVPRGYEKSSQDRRRNENYLDVTLRSGVLWKNSQAVRAGRLTLTPANLVFDPPGKMQRLPDIRVIRVPI
jgi:hypothetical protein